MDEKEFKQNNHNVLMEFLTNTTPNSDELSDSIKCILSQFVLNMRTGVRLATNLNGLISSAELVDIQQKELRRCVVDLETQKDFLTKGVTKQ